MKITRKCNKCDNEYVDFTEIEEKEKAFSYIGMIIKDDGYCTMICRETITDILSDLEMKNERIL